MQIKNEPPFYFPLASGRYEVTAGLHRLEKDFGNGPVDQQIFQFDTTFQDYHENKLDCRRERLSKFYVEQNFSKEAKKRLNNFLVSQLSREHPDKFIKHQDDNRIILNCLLTGERLVFNKEYDLIKDQSSRIDIPYTSSLDALACQFQEDISVVQLKPDGSDYITTLHLCSPNHWSAEDKIGQSFIATHQTVPHTQILNQQSSKMLQSILENDSYVRFAWGLATDNRLNHHPQAPEKTDKAEWAGRQFDPNSPKLWLRVERQTLSGIKEDNILIFTIRTYFYDVKQIKVDAEKQKQLISAIQSMSNESLAYKGLITSKVNILNWLESTN